MAKRGWGALCMLVLTVSCVTTTDVPSKPPTQAQPVITASLVAKALPETLSDRREWAEGVLQALDAHDLKPNIEAVASVLAVIEQESGFKANPTVPGLSKIVRARLDAYGDKLGPFGEPLMKKVLEGKAPGTQNTFYQRIDLLKTERDLDRLFRDILVHYRERYPVTMAAAGLLGEVFSSRSLEDLNPITTAGSMQVSVQYAMRVARENGKDPEQVREEIYTRGGGLYYGVKRLLGYSAAYNNPIYRFADFNSGFYSSRNAALQAQLSALTGASLVPDGDLLLYDKDGNALEKDSSTLRALLQWRAAYAPELSEARVRRDAHLEKTQELESTETWAALKKSYQKVTRKSPDYAHLPRVTISSPKLKEDKSTAWFARSVQVRYQKYHEKLTRLLKGTEPAS